MQSYPEAATELFGGLYSEGPWGCCSESCPVRTSVFVVFHFSVLSP